MQGTVLHAPRDIRFEERDQPKILKPTDAIIRTSVTCVCGSDLWPYRGSNPTTQPSPGNDTPSPATVVDQGRAPDAEHGTEIGDTTVWTTAE